MILNSYNNLSSFIKRHFKTLLPFLNIRKFFNTTLALLEMRLGVCKCLSRPLVYRIDPSSICNLRCPSCESWKTKTNEKRIMDARDYFIIIDKIKNVALRVSLYDMGEPLVNKDIYEMIKYASSKNISSLISTNFNLFNERDLKRLFDSKLTVLEPCLDGFTQENYQKYRVGGDVEKVKNNIRDVVKYKKDNKLKYPVIDVQVVNFDHLKNEISLIDNFLTNLGVDHITHRQENLGFNSDKTTIKIERKPSTCFWLYLGMMIRPDGSVYPCCGRDFDRFSYGNILKEDLSTIWNNKYYRFSRKLFTKGKDLKHQEEMKNIPCLNCPQFKRKRNMKN